MAVPRETQLCLDAFVHELLRWNQSINLIGKGTVETVRERHIDDCLQLAALRPAPGPHWLDMGSGGGLPAIPIACLLRGTGTRVAMMESDRRKTVFLRRIAAQLGLDADVRTGRIEALPPAEASTISARALAPLPLLLSYVSRHVAPGGVALLPKGARWEEELRLAEAGWQFDLAVHPSATEAGSVVLEVSNLRPR